MITIYIKNVFSKIINIDDNIQIQILKSTTVNSKTLTSKNAIYLFNPINNLFYTGLLNYILKILKNNNKEYKIIDLRIKPKSIKKYNIDKKMKMRPYQKNIIDNSHNRMVVSLPTGAGKTFIMANLISKYSVFPTIVIVPTIQLANQTQEEFETFFNHKVGICIGEKKQINDITVCTPMSAPNELLKKCKMILCDECHHIPSNTIFNIFKKCGYAYYRFGVSATPWRDAGDDLMIDAAINKKNNKLSLSISDITNLGYLTPCNINFIKINKIYESNDYQDLYKKAIVKNDYRNNIIKNIAIKSLNNDKTILILIKNIEHGQLLYDLIKNELKDKSLINFIYGETDNTIRENVLKDVRNKKTRILIGSTIADEGMDCKSLDTLILAGGGKSSTRAFQRIGRVLRLYKNKKVANVYDFEDKSPILYNHFLFRKSLYETETIKYRKKPAWTIKYI